MQVLSGDLHRGRWNVNATAMMSQLFEYIPLSQIRAIENLGAGSVASNTGAFTGGNFGGAAGMLVGGVPAALVGGLIGAGVGGRKQVGVTCSLSFADGRSALAVVTAGEYQLLQAAAFRHREAPALSARTPIVGPPARAHQQLASCRFRSEDRKAKRLNFRVFDDEIAWETWDGDARKVATWSIPLDSVAEVEMRDYADGIFMVVTAFDTEYPFLLDQHVIASVLATIEAQLAERRLESEPDTPQPIGDVADQIRRLHELLSIGALTAEEFEKAKTELLGRL